MAFASCSTSSIEKQLFSVQRHAAQFCWNLKKYVGLHEASDGKPAKVCPKSMVRFHTCLLLDHENDVMMPSTFLSSLLYTSDLKEALILEKVCRCHP